MSATTARTRLAWMRLMTWGKRGAGSGDILASASGRRVIDFRPEQR